MTANQNERMTQLRSYAGKMKQEASTPEEHEKWVNVLAWLILIDEDK